MVTDLLKIGGNLIDKLIPDKAEKQKMKLKLLEMEQRGQLESQKQEMSVMLEEAKSNDPWTSRARPSFLYVIYVLILAGIPFGILSAFNPEAAAAYANGFKEYFHAIPDSLWAVFGVGYTGYTVARSRDKNHLNKLKNKFTNG